MWVVQALQRNIKTTSGVSVEFEDKGMIGYLPVFLTLAEAKQAHPHKDYFEIREKTAPITHYRARRRG